MNVIRIPIVILLIFVPFVLAAEVNWWYFMPACVVVFLMFLWLDNLKFWDKK